MHPSHFTRGHTNANVYTDTVPQDPHRVPHWYREWLMNYQSYFQRYIVEDRFSGGVGWGGRGGVGWGEFSGGMGGVG